MADSDPVQTLAGKAGVSRAAAQAVLDALTEMAGKRPRDGRPHPSVAPLSFVPSSADIDALIGKARKHPLGLEFLVHGELGAVAITFGAHAFTVEAARRQLSAQAGGWGR